MVVVRAEGPRRLTRIVLFALIWLLAMASPSRAQAGASDLAQMSIEELMSIEITSASRKQQRVKEVAAAVFVITHDDIQRSGMTTIPDVLRLAPGVDVAQINANNWAVSVRGFNGLFANKLLVLVDGRSVYNRLFAGVYWNTEDLMLDDIDRIEVIRGPGAAVWGANAVNGVINIVTRTAASTAGALVRVGAGRAGEQAAIRYGGALGAAHYRLYSQWTSRNASLTNQRTAAADSSHGVTAGLRTDWAAGPGALMVEGAFTTAQVHQLWPNFNAQSAAIEPVANAPSDSRAEHVLGRWTHARADGSSLQIQSFVDVVTRRETLYDYDRRTFDVDLQFSKALGKHHDVVTGAAYRFGTDAFRGDVGFSMTPPERRSSLLTAFAQDEIGLAGNRLAVTLGTQVQNDTLAGVGIQPTARVIWKGLSHQIVWASASRALRTPSLYERGVHALFPPVPGPNGLPMLIAIEGSEQATAEDLVESEMGYRLEIGKAASIDVTGYEGQYHHLEGVETGDPVVQFVPSPQLLITSRFVNRLDAATHGLEMAGHWTPLRAWRVDGSYTVFHIVPDLVPWPAPGTQWQLRSEFSSGARATFVAALFRVGALENIKVSAYSRADVSMEWRFSGGLSAIATVQNLFDAAHAEFANSEASPMLATEVPRSGGVQFRWSIR
jgi:iron complex outermembrane receptor protein